ncbi:universal stress protein [Virgibacillus xinjiangensis]|uniref:Universal stress protein n=1 Tax=Virgibacillus xinjiangensis TaxID=393090 RepID=A0ABV7CQS6_9BACI
MSRRILVAYDGSDLSKQAVEEAKQQAAVYGETEAHVICVITPAGPSTNSAISQSIAMEVAEEFRPVLEGIRSEIAAEDVETVADVILDHSQKNAGVMLCEYAEDHDMDLIIMGSRGLGGMKRLFLGSVSNTVVHHAHCQVLIVK